MGLTRFNQELRGLHEEEVEDLLGPLPVEEMVSGVGSDDLAPLLDHLAQTRRKSAPLAAIAEQAAALFNLAGRRPGLPRDA